VAKPRTNITPTELGIYELMPAGFPSPDAPSFLTTGKGPAIRNPVTGKLIGITRDVTKEGIPAWKKARQTYNKIVPIIAAGRLRIDFDTFITDSTYPTLDGWRRYIEMGKQYVAKEGGGMIGDAIKIEYFSYGKGKWTALEETTIKHKAALANAGKIKPEVITHPLQRKTWLMDLPANWSSYLTVRGFPENKGLSKAGSRIVGHTRVGGLHRWYDMVPLMDAVAMMNPRVKFWGRTGVRSYEQMIQLVSRPGTLRSSADITQFARMQVSGVMEAFRFSPSAFHHETGYHNVKARKRVKARPFISRGVYEGMKRISHFWDIHMRDGEKVMQRRYAREMNDVITEAEKITTQYLVSGRAAAVRYRGKGGLTNLPRSYTYWGLGDTPSKYMDINITVRSMFGNHLIWWFLPPSKWWHYVGVMDDLRSIIKGGVWSLGSIQAWVTTMMKGIAGARLGSPIPFTRKSRRRKFRKGLYSRAGYHRQYVGAR